MAIKQWRREQGFSIKAISLYLANKTGLFHMSIHACTCSSLFFQFASSVVSNTLSFPIANYFHTIVHQNIFRCLFFFFSYKAHKGSYKAARSDFLAVTVSNNFQYKKIVLESYRLSPVYTSKINLLSKLKIFKVTKNNFFKGIQKKKPNAS